MTMSFEDYEFKLQKKELLRESVASIRCCQTEYPRLDVHCLGDKCFHSDHWRLIAERMFLSYFGYF